MALAGMGRADETGERATHGPQGSSVAAFMSRLRELAECLGDGLITFAGGVLVNHGGAPAGVAEPGHQFFDGRASASGKGTARVPQAVGVRADSVASAACLEPD